MSPHPVLQFVASAVEFVAGVGNSAHQAVGFVSF